MSDFNAYNVSRIREIAERHRNDRIELVFEKKIRLALEAKVAICDVDIFRAIQKIIVATYQHKQSGFESLLKIVESHPEINLLEDLDDQTAYFVLDNDLIQISLNIINEAFSLERSDALIQLIVEQVEISGLNNVIVADIKRRHQTLNSESSNQVSKRKSYLRITKALEFSNIFPTVRQFSSFSPGLHIVERIYESASSLNTDEFYHYEKCLFALCQAHVSQASYIELKEDFERVVASFTAFERKDVVLAYHVSMIHDAYIFGQYSVAENFSTLFELLSSDASNHSSLVFPHADMRRIKALAEVTATENALDLSLDDLASKLKPIINAGRIIDLNTLPKNSQKEAYLSLGVIHQHDFGRIDIGKSSRHRYFDALDDLGVNPIEQRRILAQVEETSSSMILPAMPSGGSFPSVGELKIQKAGMALNFGAHMLAIGAGTAALITTAIPASVGGTAAAVAGVGFMYKEIFDVTSTAVGWAKEHRERLRQINNDLEIAKGIENIEEFSDIDNTLLLDPKTQNDEEHSNNKTSRSGSANETVDDGLSSNKPSESSSANETVNDGLSTNKPSESSSANETANEEEPSNKPDNKDALSELGSLGTSINPAYYDSLPSVAEILFQGYLKLCKDWLGLILTKPGEDISAGHAPITLYNEHGCLVKILPLILYFEPLEVRLHEHRKLFSKPGEAFEDEESLNSTESSELEKDVEYVYIGGRKYHVCSFQVLNAPLVLFTNNIDT